MNTVGKILVILNFLFAVIVGALLVVDLATRHNWKEKYNELLKEAKVLKDGRDATYKVTGGVTRDFKDMEIELEKRNQKIKDQEDKAAIDVIEYREKLGDLANKMNEKDQVVKATKQALDRLTQENNILTKTIADRENSIVALEGSIKTFRMQAQNFEAIARTRQIQNENLLERLREVELALNRKEAGISDRIVPVKLNEPNPPAVKIDGKVEKVEGMLVQVSLGTDHGLKENNTLDVYRLSPNPLYLGMVRITDARHHTSVGRLIPASNAVRTQLREGDLVTSKFK